MTIIVSMILYIFGLDVLSGKYENQTNTNNVQTDSSGNIIIYDPEYNSIKNPVYYQSPNIVVPNPQANDNLEPVNAKYVYIPNTSSSPEYQS